MIIIGTCFHHIEEWVRKHKILAHFQKWSSIEHGLAHWNGNGPHSSFSFGTQRGRRESEPRPAPNTPQSTSSAARSAPPPRQTTAPTRRSPETPRSTARLPPPPAASTPIRSAAPPPPPPPPPARAPKPLPAWGAARSPAGRTWPPSAAARGGWRGGCVGGTARGPPVQGKVEKSFAFGLWDFVLICWIESEKDLLNCSLWKFGIRRKKKQDGFDLVSELNLTFLSLFLSLSFFLAWIITSLILF